MKLSPAQFNHVSGNCLCAGKVEPIEYYSYESAERLYDVLLVCGKKIYNVNGKQYANGQLHHPIHREIEKHFSI